MFGGGAGGDVTRDDPTQLLTTLRVTDLCGIVSLMYGVLLHSGAPTRGATDSPTTTSSTGSGGGGAASTPELSAPTLAILTTGFRMLNQLATFDLALLQVSC